MDQIAFFKPCKAISVWGVDRQWKYSQHWLALQLNLVPTYCPRLCLRFSGRCGILMYGQLLLFRRLSPVLQSTACRTRSRGRCWAAIRLSHCLEPSGRAVHEEVNGLDIGGQHGRRFVLLRHTHRPQRRSYSICASRSECVRHRCAGG